MFCAVLTRVVSASAVQEAGSQSKREFVTADLRLGTAGPELQKNSENTGMLEHFWKIR